MVPVKKCSLLPFTFLWNTYLPHVTKHLKCSQIQYELQKMDGISWNRRNMKLILTWIILAVTETRLFTGDSKANFIGITSAGGGKTRSFPWFICSSGTSIGVAIKALLALVITNDLTPSSTLLIMLCMTTVWPTLYKQKEIIYK